MTRLCRVFFLLAAAGVAVAADQPARSAAVKKLAQELGDATIKGEFAKVIDHTHDTVVKELGGRDEAIKTTESIMTGMKARGITIKVFRVGEPGEFLTEGSNTFVVVPTTTEMAIPDGKIVGKSYLLGISADDGKTWKFVDGAGMDNKELRDKVLPKLPAKLKLPEKVKPEIIKDK